MSFAEHSPFSAVKRSRIPVMAHVIFFCYSSMNNALSYLCEGDSLISSISRDTLFTNETHEKLSFDYWYRIITV